VSTVVFRVDASTAIGTGHVLRCRTLACALREKGASVRFVTRAHSGHLGDLLAQDGFTVSMLQSGVNAQPDADNHASWLGVGLEQDATETMDALAGEWCDWAIVDHYGLDRAWESRLRSCARNIMVIDDLADRAHDCDVLLDPNFAEGGEARYRARVPADCRLLLGPRYALLRPEYAKYDASRSRRAGPLKRVLLFMGGADKRNVTSIAMSALAESRFAHLELDVVVGASSPHRDSVRAQAAKRPGTRVHSSLPHLAGLMADADLAIGAGGGTTWERMCLGLPGIVISIAENQRPGCNALARAGLIRYLGDASSVDASIVAAALDEAMSRPDEFRAMGAEAQGYVDGKGAERVAEALMPTADSDLALRRATSGDVMTYYGWANDPVVRANSIDSSPISLRSHLRWFDDRLKDPDCFLFVVEAGTLPVGQIRFDRASEGLRINYSLDSLVRGRGWAKKVLDLGIRALRVAEPTQLNAVVKTGNPASAAAFIRAGFAEQATAGGMRRFTLRFPRVEH
jgi:UDP-2,4-diacetamido-2,4,6-trideoxy-beta-L-altropyranose hydrolase